MRAGRLTVMRLPMTLAVLMVTSVSIAAVRTVSFPGADGSLLYGDLYGSGNRGVVILAHGGYSTRESWKPVGEALEAERFQVLIFESRAAADFAAGRETPCFSDERCQSRDVLAAIRHLQRRNATQISLIGGSLGAAAIALAAIEAEPQIIDGLVLLAPAAIAAPGRIPGRKLYVTARTTPTPPDLVCPRSRHSMRGCAHPRRSRYLKAPRTVSCCCRRPTAPLCARTSSGFSITPERTGPGDR